MNRILFLLFNNEKIKYTSNTELSLYKRTLLKKRNKINRYLNCAGVQTCRVVIVIFGSGSSLGTENRLNDTVRL